MREKSSTRLSQSRVRKTIGPAVTPTSFVAEALNELIEKEVASNTRHPKTLSKWAMKMRMSVLKKGSLLSYRLLVPDS